MREINKNYTGAVFNDVKEALLAVNAPVADVKSRNQGAERFPFTDS